MICSGAVFKLLQAIFQFNRRIFANGANFSSCRGEEIIAFHVREPSSGVLAMKAASVHCFRQNLQLCIYLHASRYGEVHYVSGLSVRCVEDDGGYGISPYEIGG